MLLFSANKLLDCSSPCVLCEVNKSAPVRKGKKESSFHQFYGIYSRTGALCFKKISSLSPPLLKKKKKKLEMFTVCHCHSLDLTTGSRTL